MLPLISDHNFNGRILRGLRRRVPKLDLVRALEVGLASADDPELLDRAAADSRRLQEPGNVLPALICRVESTPKCLPGDPLNAKAL